MKQMSLRKSDNSSQNLSRIFPLLAILGIMFAIFLMRGTPVFAAEPQSFGTEASINPLYKDTLTEAEQEDILAEAETIAEKNGENASEYTPQSMEDPSESPRLDSNTTYTDAALASASLRDQMVPRQSELTVKYQFSYQGFSSLSKTEQQNVCISVASDLFFGAFDHTGDSQEGDYLRWSYSSMKVNGDLSSYTAQGNNVTLNLGYTVTYYTTADQETLVNETLSETEASLGLSENASDYDIISAIYQYITKNVSYDYGTDKIKYTAYSALINHKAVCEGFAALFYRMALDYGIDARVVSGYSRNVNHGWNIVKVGSSYYYLDSTWDSTKTSWSYFLLGSDNFLKTHTLATSGELAPTSAELIANYSIYTTDFTNTAFDNNNYNPRYGTGIYTLNDRQAYYVRGYRSHTTNIIKTDGSWYNLNNGLVTPGPTVARNSYGWWYIDENGMVDFNYCGLAKNSYGWWYLKNGLVDFTYNGFVQNSYGWWYVTNGKVDFSANSVIKGTVEDENAWWYVVNGKVTYDDTVAKNTNGWWYIKNGKVDFSFNGFSQNSYGWWYIENGKVNFSANSVSKGIVANETAWWHVVNGKVTYDTTVAKNSYGWWYIKNGKADFSFLGIASNAYGSWYLSGGKVQFGYTGTITYQGKAYRIVKGKVS